MAAPVALDLAAVHRLSSLADVHRLLHEANAAERGIDAELEALLSRRGELEQGLAALHSSTTEVCVGRMGWGQEPARTGTARRATRALAAARF